MKVLVLNVEDGSSRQCEEEEISQDDLQMLDQASVDIIRWDQDSQQYQRAAVEIEGEDYKVAQWNAL